MTQTLHASDTPKQVLERFYKAEANYMKTRAATGTASFDEMRATLAPDVILHQSPDLPFGGEYVGHKRYEDWAICYEHNFRPAPSAGPRVF